MQLWSLLRKNMGKNLPKLMQLRSPFVQKMGKFPLLHKITGKNLPKIMQLLSPFAQKYGQKPPKNNAIFIPIVQK